jgi:hypothetical protein
MVAANFGGGDRIPGPKTAVIMAWGRLGGAGALTLGDLPHSSEPAAPHVA